MYEAVYTIILAYGEMGKIQSQVIKTFVKYVSENRDFTAGYRFVKLHETDNLNLCF
jgi:hypothetical protein